MDSLHPPTVLKASRHLECSICTNTLRLVTDPAPLDDLESLRYLADSGRETGAAGDKPQEQGLLLVSERGQSLPQPLYQLILFINAIAIPTHTHTHDSQCTTHNILLQQILIPHKHCTSTTKVKLNCLCVTTTTMNV